MYNWFNHHMAWGHKAIVEQDFKLLSKEEHAVWNAKHPKPKGGDAFERKLTKWIADRDAKLVKKMTKAELRAAWGMLIGRKAPAFKDITREKVDEFKRDGYIEFLDILRLKKHGEAIPVVSLYPTKKWNKVVQIILSGKGKDALFDAKGNPKKGIREFLDSGSAVISADLFQQGEFLKAPLKQTRKVRNNREYAGYSFGYNHTLFAHRVHDVMTLVAWVTGFEEEKPELIGLRDIGGSGLIVAAAASQVNGLKFVSIRDFDFRFADLKSYRDPNFFPGAVKYGDLSALVKISKARVIYIPDGID
jgi:hypothetical protein